MPCSNEPSLGPAASCRTLDFTLGFEYRVLFVLHYALCVVLLAQLALRSLYDKRRVTTRRVDLLMALKLVVVAFGVAVTAAALGISQRAFAHANLPGLQNWATAAYALQLVFVVRKIRPSLDFS
ncbi:hypothetical protein EXIGLDRAFT_767324 [Exidia glandulosa HHB12029]|uniref:ABC transporter TMD0 domain-containing protein n=1 Tax=Exidia glandulosa HHB12029 TaxID=1314781 RepID=A0A165J339_EXIGL|nr:hypothetical protein EXIGLDRAFT_767324 [Exidia glandulosa HHB12029]